MLAFGLAACGGGSSTTPDPEPTPTEVAQDALAAAKTALAALSATASDADRLAAQRRVVTAATAVVTALLEADAKASLVDPARAEVRTAQAAVDATQKRIDDAAETARQAAMERERVAAEQLKIDTANDALETAEASLAAAERHEAPDSVLVVLQRGVHAAAMDLVTVLQAAEIPVDAADISAAEMNVTAAQAVLSATEERIRVAEEEADRLEDEGMRVSAAQTALNEAKAAVTRITTDPTVTPIDDALLQLQGVWKEKAEALVALLKELDRPTSEVEAAELDVAAAQTAIDATQGRIDAEAARVAEMERQRMEAVKEAEKIAAARQELMDAKDDRDELAANASLADRKAAREAVLEKAKMLVTALEAAMYHEVTLADVDAARADEDSAQRCSRQATIDGGKYDDEQLMDARTALATATAAGTIPQAIKDEVLRTLALPGNADETATKQEMLYQAQASMDLQSDDPATKLAAQRMVLAAAEAWKMELEEMDAAHSLVMMAQGEVDEAQEAVDMTVAMMERGMQIANNVDEANNLADAVRDASGARTTGGTPDTAGGFDRTLVRVDGTPANDEGHQVNIAFGRPDARPRFTLSEGQHANDESLLPEYSNKDVPDPQPITDWYGEQFRAMDDDDMETGRVVVYTNIDQGTHVPLNADSAITSRPDILASKIRRRGCHHHSSVDPRG